MSAQDEETIAISEDACGCIKEIDLSIKKEAQYDSIKSCISSAILGYQLKNTLFKLSENIPDSSNTSKNLYKDSISVPKNIDITIVADKNFDIIERYSLSNCSSMQRIMASYSETNESSISTNKKALEFYDKGLAYFEQEKYGNAIVEFSKAVKKDKNFAFAWDNLGLSYRKQEQFNQAINAYNKSLKIDPSEKMPLMNKAVAYAMLKDYHNAIKSYKDMIAFYPDDAESYYGIARIYHAKGDYENAVENMMRAYSIYKEANSPYIHDAETNLSIYYKELKAKDQLDIFDTLSAKYKIKIKE